MKRDFSPKQVARAIGASESSLKRWCDQGVLKTTKTAGGHRRISLDEVFSFLRTQNRELENPDILGLPVSSGAGERVVTRARDKLLKAMVAGEEPLCRRIVLDLYAAGHPLIEICDDVIANVFRELGDLWECGTVDIFQERLGCEIAARIMHDLNSVLPPSKPGAPLAIGGSLSGDHYTLASSMVEIVLRSLGWRAQRLGTNLPFESMANSIRQRKPRLFWLSVSYIEDVNDFILSYEKFYGNRDQATTFVLGGRAITPEIRSKISFSGYCDNMRQLADFVTAISAPPQISEGKN